MKWLQRVLATLIVVVFGWVSLHAQAEQALGRGFDAAMAANAREWRPDPAVSDRAGQHQKRWLYGEAKVTVTYSIESSPQAAAQALQRKIAVIPVGPIEPVSGFGDEAYILAQYNSTGITRVFFRRGATIVEVSAPAETLARRFASLFLAEVDKGTGKREPQK